MFQIPNGLGFPSPTYILPLPEGGGGLQEGEGIKQKDLLPKWLDSTI